MNFSRAPSPDFFLCTPQDRFTWALWTASGRDSACRSDRRNPITGQSPGAWRIASVNQEILQAFPVTSAQIDVTGASGFLSPKWASGTPAGYGDDRSLVGCGPALFFPFYNLKCKDYICDMLIKPYLEHPYG
jgi:hypothetical protein